MRQAIHYKSISDYIKDTIGKEKSIVLLVDEFSKGSGPAKVVELQARELLNEGYDVSIFALEADMQPPVGANLNIIGVPKHFILKILHNLFLPLNFWKSIMWCRELKDFDVLIAHQHCVAWLSYLAKRLYGTKFIYYNHPVVSINELFPGFWYQKYMQINEKLHQFLAKRADHVVSISEYARKILLEEIGVDSVVIYNKVDHRKFHPNLDGKRIRDRYNLGDSPIILFVGRVVPSKRLNLLIDIFKKVKTVIPDVKLIIVGKSPFKWYLEELKKLIKPHDTEVLFVGYVPDEELPYYYAACDVYATASFHEGFNLPAVEAQECGKPVVAFDIGSHKEVVKNGFLVRKGDVERFARKLIEVIECRGKET